MGDRRRGRVMPRERLRERHGSETFSLDAFGIRWHVSFSRFDDGRIGEVFIDGPKAGADMAAVARDAAICLSLAFQHGVPPHRLREAVTRSENGEPAGLVGVVLDHVTAMAA